MANSEPSPGYAGVDAVLKAIGRFRDRGLPSKVDRDFMVQIGISEGSSYQVLASLLHLGLVDEKGLPTDHLRALHSASQDEYPSELARTLQRAYTSVFAAVDPESAPIESIDDAFRVFKPFAQRNRMTRLFVRLCEEAGIRRAEDKPAPTTRQATKRRQAKDMTNRNGGASASESAVQEPPRPVCPPAEQPREGPDAAVLAIIRLLPGRNGWTQAEFDLWVSALTATVKLTSPIRPLHGEGPAQDE